MRKRLSSNNLNFTIDFVLFYRIRNHLSHILFEWQYFRFKAQCPGPGWSQSSDLGALRTPPCALRRASRSYVLRAQGPEIRFGREKLGSFETRLRERKEIHRTQVDSDSDTGQEIQQWQNCELNRDRENVTLHKYLRLQTTSDIKLNWNATQLTRKGNCKTTKQLPLCIVKLPIQQCLFLAF